ncbi:MAG: asparagine synthase (glutamine-hydrolyzing) [Lachnospiraceae bacterium]
MGNIMGFFHPERVFTKEKGLYEHALDSMTEAFVQASPASSLYSSSYLSDHFGLAWTLASPRTPSPTLPFIKKYQGHDFGIVWDGELYNARELSSELIKRGHFFHLLQDADIVLSAYLEFGPSFAEKLNGAFAFAIMDPLKNHLMLCRDRAGTKPLFYCVKEGTVIFSSQLKGLFAFDGARPVLNKDSLNEIFGIGPAKTRGTGVFYHTFEVLPAHFLLCSTDGISPFCYWKLESHPHEDSYEDTIKKTSFLLEDSVKRQMKLPGTVCSFLSGGIDSSLVSAICAKELQKDHQTLSTFSFDFAGNDKNFQANDFQPSQDRPFVEKMVAFLKSNHRYLECSAQKQFDLLKLSVLCHDLPAMADVDSSLLYFCSQVAPDFSAALTGECADEIFGGYPWFHKESCFHAKTFPWTMDLNARKVLLSDDFLSWLSMDDYVQNRYENSISQVPKLEGEDSKDARRREISYLNLEWFMQTLLDRMNRTSEIWGLSARVPFADYRIIEYLWNVPWEMKAKDGIVKNLLRQAGRGKLPDEVLFRKKSPYPKIYDRSYETLLKNRLLELAADPNAPVLEFCDKKKIMAFASSPSDYGKPWYGQLLAGPQMMAYIIQIDFWLRHYKPNILI